MSQIRKSTIEVQGTAIAIFSAKNSDFVLLPDMLKAKDVDFFITDWLRNRNTVEFLGIWESINTPDFNHGEFATIGSQSGHDNYKTIAKEWVEKIRERPSLGAQGRSFPPKSRRVWPVARTRDISNRVARVQLRADKIRLRCDCG